MSFADVQVYRHESLSQADVMFSDMYSDSALRDKSQRTIVRIISSNRYKRQESPAAFLIENACGISTTAGYSFRLKYL